MPSVGLEPVTPVFEGYGHMRNIIREENYWKHLYVQYNARFYNQAHVLLQKGDLL